MGTSGWVYPSWKGTLYRGVPRRRWLERAASVFDTVEINGSFYTQIKPATYRAWHDATPCDTPTFRDVAGGDPSFTR